ncbi:MAG: formylglycine-generating enzyme family protein, partial [Flammeovirgaceae bacterium]
VIDLDAGVNLTGLLKHFYLLRLPKWAYLLFFVGLFVMVLLLVGIGGYFVKNNYDSIQTASTERMVAIKGGRTTIGQSGKGVIDNPSHEVLLDAYWIDQFEVTVKQYVAFCKTQNYKLPKDPKFQTMPNYFTDSRWENYPAVNVTWYDAQKYCDCLHKRLPTEAEWENAARNTTIKNVKQFQTSMENYPDRSLLAYSPNYGIIEGKADAYPFTAEVGSFSKNSYHLFDMGGNVSEWCLDSYSKDFYLIGQIDNPVNQEESDYAVVRGPSWLEWKGGNVAKRDRKKKSMGYRNVGFRCVTTNQSN